MLHRVELPVIVNARFLTQPVTGVQRFAIEISLHLKRLLPNVVFVSPQEVLNKDIAKILEVVKIGKVTGHAWEQAELPLYLRKQGSPLLINLCNTAPLLYKNKVVCIHDLAFLVNPQWFSRMFSQLYKVLIPRVVKSSRKILTVSEFSKGSIKSILHVPDSDIEVIYNAVSENIFNSLEKKINNYGDYILAVGSLDPRKNLKRLILAFNSCKLKETKLVIVGAASKVFKDEELQQLVQENRSIILTGYLTDEELKNAYQHAKIFIYPSLFEGFGLPPLEAMHCGCATVVSNTTSLPEVCADASLYVNPNSVEELANRMSLLIENESLRSSLIMKGFERSKHFSWEKSSKRLVQVIESLR
ncbi:glycosyltransferase family 4 protein [Pontibacter silvestris]|uniref:Glycosyltransferase family 4 protein n=1 Tax=Pontibacter silvestris TaxID=2305183 RepID=A0ABW4X0Q8_9BACT|nr:glycosyltransferase family 1 protein [Pontibacter silvestris]MCC9135132.1 glycosyltransferase family 4 protein [Pontibacter silvestris]